MNHVFDAYAQYYDLLYQDKDYAAEAEFVASRLRAHGPDARKILELGCGTGIHAAELARMGYAVHGVDLSEGMVSRANSRRDVLPADVAARLSFAQGDIRDLKMNPRYDAAVSLFHVMSYQTSNDDLGSALASAHGALRPGGLFIFDFWFGPAVLTQRPDVRIRRLESESSKLVRIAEPVMHARRNVVDVEFTVFVEDKASGAIARICETHPMRYLFLPELEQLAAPKFKIVEALGWMSTKQPETTDWAACVVLRRRS